MILQGWFVSTIVAIVASFATCVEAGWDETRRTAIDPINSEFHRHLPKYLKDRDLAALLALYGTETGTGLTWSDPDRVYLQQPEETLRWQSRRGPEPIADRYRTLLEMLPTIEKAECRIRAVDWRRPTAEGFFPAEARLLVRGIRGDGSHCQLDQRTRVTIGLRDHRWLIMSEEVLSRETVATRRPRYAVATHAAGIDNVHTNDGSPVFRILGTLTNSSGSAVGDFDQDGCEDVFLAGSPMAALYRNTCNGGFTDVTETAGLPRPYPAAATGTVFFDYDNDGRPDLYVSAVKGGDRLFHNVGGRFIDVTQVAGIPKGEWASMPIVADYDRDGNLDVYVVRMGDHEKTAPKPSYEARNGVPNTLLRNNGNGTFTDVSKTAGVADRGWGLAGAWGDYDNDGWPDIYLGNEFGFSVLYRNRGDGRFEDVTWQTAAADRAATMGTAWGDYDNDGFLDVFASNMYANSRWALPHPDFPAPIPIFYRVLSLFTDEVRRRSDQIFDELTRGSTLLRNNGDGTFANVSDLSGIRDTQWSWGAEFLDYNNDGLLDLYVVNGFVSGPNLDDV